MNQSSIENFQPVQNLNSEPKADNQQVSPSIANALVGRSSFRSAVLSAIKVPVERIAFRKDTWGEVATVYYANAFPSTSIGDDYDDDLLECFLLTVAQGSRSFVAKAKECFGKDWKKHVRCRS